MSYRDRLYAKYASWFQNKQSFDREAAIRWGRGMAAYFKGWLPDRRDAAIVDLACGSGQLLYFLSSQGYTNLKGVDISAEQVELARQAVPGVEVGNVIEWIASRSSEFDLILAQDIIEHLHKDEVLAFLDGCVGALKPGGRIIIQTPNAESPWFGTIRYGDFTHEVGFNTHSLGKLMQLCGLGGIQSREIGPIPHGAASMVRYVAWQFIRLWLKVWNLAEVGSTGSGVYTRVFVISGMKGT